ncbi:UDP-N-acetylmuramoyl-L-alanyl-D-glutamate--2,6-diaminopimelate ligase [Blochmannia endosymbiont of Camponotus (Colobopsis) obliquus]|uniref:UDP-N-acetylmuramoyl-L-alanyl-D-glutamate--2, 6-diaminopimelate ligase n=1 Tax=Blochmannia endosymbiont of Camponotus (Colobopsis) obliquus TaxID=1505597 RepID=UPI00061A7D4A|nr:UDP-N-acetylmuramoyl-L-alanyl-D-glutamate--2,6-diaminopimelate ligase [Blochmannia endosymbiont of Camponotus (Colobopsis) obliquus]AKC60312.1 UDP-N-acetylmuramoyl-L-alanyl-D-glutamate--2,6-diaminopimelate ligase [Blochmannia endosymbiont of Camponotus (Colobopsis) obliquus]
MNNCSLQYLLAPWIMDIPNSFFKDMVTDSRDVSCNDLFVALEGHRTNGYFYISDALAQGASAIIAQCNNRFFDKGIFNYRGIPIVYINQLQQYLSAIAGRFFNHPSKFFRLVGVTGTNGKTTITHLLSNWVFLLNEISAVMGTIGNGIIGNICPSKNTTCSAIEIQKMLAQFRKQGVTFVAIEVSSHGLAEDRVKDLCFDAAVFTNLTQDHLDYHGNMFNYELVKWQLFSVLKAKEFVINCDDTVGRKWLLKLPHAVAVSILGNFPCDHWSGRWLRVIKAHYYSDHTKIIFDSSWGHGLINTQLVGTFNVSNLLLAMATLLVLKYPLSLLLSTVVKLQNVCGRMEVFRVINYPIIIVDYAHNPGALKQSLLTSRLYSRGKLCCVFGCGGDRDKAKRSLMGVIAERYADNIIITNDNPRNENPQDIIDDIKKTILDKTNVKVITSRSEAIDVAIRQCSPDDLVLISGKGHEDYQLVGNKRLNYSDLITVKKILGMV